MDARACITAASKTIDAAHIFHGVRSDHDLEIIVSSFVRDLPPTASISGQGESEVINPDLAQRETVGQYDQLPA